jgi:hypothetical protein
VRALSPYSKPEVPSATRAAAADYLHEAVFTRADRDPCTHNALVSFLMLQDSSAELNACATPVILGAFLLGCLDDHA